MQHVCDSNPHNTTETGVCRSGLHEVGLRILRDTLGGVGAASAHSQALQSILTPAGFTGVQQLYWELTAAFPLLEGDTLAAEMSCTLIKTNPAFSTFLHLPEPAGRLEMRAAGFLLTQDPVENRPCLKRLETSVSPASVGLF